MYLKKEMFYFRFAVYLTTFQVYGRIILLTAFVKCVLCDTLFGNPLDNLPNIPNECGVFSASCAETLQYCILHCHGPTIPFSLVVSYRNGTFEQGNLST